VSESLSSSAAGVEVEPSVSLRSGRLARRNRSLSRLRVGILYSRVRVEEKWIFAAMDRLGLHYDRLDDRGLVFDLEHPEPWLQYDVVLERSLSYTSGLYALRLLNGEFAEGDTVVADARKGEVVFSKAVQAQPV